MPSSLRYALTTPGRAVIALEADDLRVAMQATDNTDALGDNARATASLLEGGERASVAEDRRAYMNGVSSAATRWFTSRSTAGPIEVPAPPT